MASTKKLPSRDPDINNLLERMDILEKEKSNLDSENQLHRMESEEMCSQNKALSEKLKVETKAYDDLSHKTQAD